MIVTTTIATNMKIMVFMIDMMILEITMMMMVMSMTIMAMETMTMTADADVVTKYDGCDDHHDDVDDDGYDTLMSNDFMIHNLSHDDHKPVYLPSDICRLGAEDRLSCEPVNDAHQRHDCHGKQPEPDKDEDLLVK